MTDRESVITASDLSTHTTELLTEVGFRGASFTILRYKKPIARLVPVPEVEDAAKEHGKLKLK